MSWAPKGTVPGMVHPKVAQVAIANILGAGTIREIQVALGAKSPNSAHNYVRRAGALGLVRYEPGKQGTLRRPACRLVEDWGLPVA